MEPTPWRSSGAPRRLERSQSDRMLAGVAGGVAAYAGVDATVVRLLFVLLTVFGGSGAILYLAGILLMPTAGGGPSTVDRWRGAGGA